MVAPPAAIPQVPVAEVAAVPGESSSGHAKREDVAVADAALVRDLSVPNDGLGGLTSPARQEAPAALSTGIADGRTEIESALDDDVLPQAVSVSIVREAMAAEKTYRPILFAGPLKRVTKTPAPKNGAAAGVGPLHSTDVEAASRFDEAPSAKSPASVSTTDEPSAAPSSVGTSPPESPAEAPHDSVEETAPSATEVAESEAAAKPDAETVERERRKSKRRKAVSSALLAAANRAKAAYAADAEEHGERGRAFADPWDYLRAASFASAPAAGPTIRTGQEPDEDEITPDKIVRSTPPFAVSLVLHVVLIVLLTLIVLPGFQSRPALELDMNYATEDSELMEAIELDLPNEMEIETDDPFSTDLVEAADPLASALELPDSLGSFDFTTPGTLGQPSVGFAGRDEGTKQALLSAFGGTVATEDAVKLGLGWMKRQQQPDGRWLLSGPYTNGCSLENPAAATSMALLAFLGDGNTPTEGEFRQTMTKGADALLRFQDSDGNFYVGPEGQHRLYTQAQATIAVCELYGMTGDERFREAAELAVEYCLRSQAPEGGWRYYPGQESDTSVTGWFVMALKSAEMAGIDVPQESFDRISAYFDKVQDEEGWRYKYRIVERDYSKTMTAEAVLCRQYLGWDHDDLRMRKAVDYILQSPIATDEREVYYWYYASQTLHHYGGEEWEAWNANLREVLPAIQEKKGREQGSWSPRDDEWGSVGGRLFMTSLCLYTLEIYYRHLPLYQQAGEATAKP